ncbi:uncharacterized protein [Drosophila suzukii]|uniref:Integrase catalytic domain-containing protein n=1 Tax=Drosophila suzukii TaxID=28584 RepID=A0ABM4TXR9_DROSZ
MDAVGQFRCPRHYFGHGARTIELHVFVDLRVRKDEVRADETPRLELQAAVLGTRLMNTVKEKHSVDISQTVLWTDSKTVLRWIGSTHRRYNQFVGNRVAEILKSSKVSQWRWVPTADNAADDATRSQNNADLSPESRWLSGPAFLRQPVSGWPAPEEGTKRVPDAPEEGTKRVPDARDEEEMPSEFALVAANEFVIPFQRFSSFSRLVRTTAWVLRFARWCRKQRSEIEEYGLTASECEAAENLLVRQAQLESFPDEMRSAECGKDVASSSEIRAPYVDEHGVLRVYGRTRAIHLKLAHDLSTDFCIIAIRNFVCRRGPVHRLRSDNGKNFVGADREAKRFGDVFETERIQSELSSGVWERMVQCVKRVLRHTLKEVAPRDHVLESFLIEAENVVNSRPLTHLPVDADQEAPLTPNDLLMGAANLPNTPGLDAELPKEGFTRKQWRIVRMLRDRFWRRWVLE